MAEAYKVVDIPNRVPNQAVFLEEQRAIEHITKYGGRLKRLVEHGEVERLREIVDEVHSWAVCGAITSFEDLAENLPRIVEITAP